MVHQYKMGGYNIAIDVNSGAIHVLDDMTYDMVELYEKKSQEEIKSILAERYPQQADEIDDAWNEMQEQIIMSLILQILPRDLQWSRHYVCIYHMIVTWLASTASQKRVSTMAVSASL